MDDSLVCGLKDPEILEFLSWESSASEAFYDWAVLAARYEGLTGAAADARIK